MIHLAFGSSLNRHLSSANMFAVLDNCYKIRLQKDIQQELSEKKTFPK